MKSNGRDLRAKVAALFGKPTDWAERVVELENELGSVQVKIEPLRAERAELALLIAENDADAVQEGAHLAAEIETLEGRRSTLLDALLQARAALSQQQARAAATAEAQRRAEARRIGGELLALDNRADELITELAGLLDARTTKISELAPFAGTDVARRLAVRNHPERVLRAALRGHIAIEGLHRESRTLADLDAALITLPERTMEAA